MKGTTARAVFVLTAAAAWFFPVAAQQTPQRSPHGDGPAAAECSLCHTSTGWLPARDRLLFDHDTTEFALTGRHAATACVGCHLDLRFDAPRISPVDCAGCHVDVHQGRLSSACTDCHNTASFRDAGSVDQHIRRGFPLVGAHVQLACESCHTDDRNGAFTARDSECLGCHRGDYEGARAFDHVSAGAPADCLQCHTMTSWRGAGFDHAAAGFPLNGRHAASPCAGCHIPGGGLRYTAAGPGDCVGCHRDDYDREHAAVAFPVACADCHTVDGWERGAFDHAAASGYELLGTHAAAACSSCHIPPHNALAFPAAPTGASDCVACHRPDYDREHGSSGYPQTCADCHGNDRWEDATFDHAAVGAGYALRGVHRSAACTSCHVESGSALVFNPAPASADDCIACHRQDFDGEHAGSSFPTTCLTCHTEDDWEHAAFDHVALGNGFALIGGHQAAACSACHIEPGNALRFAPPPSGNSDCVACHRSDYDTQHTGSGFSTNCLDCHTQDVWTGATFDHAAAAKGFALIGSHQAAACSGCHVQPGNALRFNPAPAGSGDCIACHRPDYDGEHAGSGFSTNCLDCHTQDTFAGATFDHDAQFFPIYSGDHRGKWATCQTCHTVPNDASAFTCFNCHEHRRSEADSEHSDVDGYSYDSAACYSCHPRGDS